MKKLLILGGGTAGTMVADRLCRLLDCNEWSITIVDQHESHYYQPGFLFIPFGIYSILSDNAARTPAFGANSVLKLSRPAAVKTGTTNDYKDNWTIGYTPDLVTGVWVGNADNKEMQGVSGVSGAGPIWHNFMEAALANRAVQDFVRPDGIVEREVCAWSGAEASQYCPDKRVELFVADQPPPPADQDVFQMLNCNGAEQVVLLVPDNVYDGPCSKGILSRWRPGVVVHRPGNRLHKMS